MFRDKIIIAGSGGQGALRIGQILSYAAVDKGWQVEWMPSYGAEMRGGTANCNVTISDEAVLFPMISIADCCIIMNKRSLMKFTPMLKAGGDMIIDNSVEGMEVDRENINIYYVPANSIATKQGNRRGANMVLLGAFLAINEKLTIEDINTIIDDTFTGRKAVFAQSNKDLVREGYHFIKGGEHGQNV